MLKILNFPHKWIGWVRECVSITSANFLVNGVTVRGIQIREGNMTRRPSFSVSLLRGYRMFEPTHEESGEGRAHQGGIGGKE